MMHGDIRGLGMRKQLWSHQWVQTDSILRAGCKVWFFLRFSFSTWEGSIFHTIQRMHALTGGVLITLGSLSLNVPGL